MNSCETPAPPTGGEVTPPGLVGGVAPFVLSAAISAQFEPWLGMPLSLEVPPSGLTTWPLPKITLHGIVGALPDVWDSKLLSEMPGGGGAWASM